MMVPILIGLGARWSATTEIDRLRNANSLLQVENGSYRAATGELLSRNRAPAAVSGASAAAGSVAIAAAKVAATATDAARIAAQLALQSYMP